MRSLLAMIPAAIGLAFAGSAFVAVAAQPASAAPLSNVARPELARASADLQPVHYRHHRHHRYYGNGYGYYQPYYQSYGYRPYRSYGYYGGGYPIVSFSFGGGRPHRG